MPPPKKPPSDAAAVREMKLGQALRANLRRRKAGDPTAKTAETPLKSGDDA